MGDIPAAPVAQEDPYAPKNPYLDAACYSDATFTFASMSRPTRTVRRWHRIRRGSPVIRTDTTRMTVKVMQRIRMVMSMALLVGMHPSGARLRRYQPDRIVTMADMQARHQGKILTEIVRVGAPLMTRVVCSRHKRGRTKIPW